MKKTTRTNKEVIEEIIEYFKNNQEVFNDCMEELDSYNGYLGDDRYYSMDELDELYSGIYKGIETSELLRMAFYGYDEETYTTDEYGNKTYYGSFNPNREYFRYNGYGNLVSADYKDYSNMLEPFAIRVIRENRDYIESIDNEEKLKTLFDELEEAKEEN